MVATKENNRTEMKEPSYSTEKVKCSPELTESIQDIFNHDGDLIPIIVWKEDNVLKIRANWYKHPNGCFDPIYILHTEFISVEITQDGYIIKGK